MFRASTSLPLTSTAGVQACAITKTITKKG
jgi:hypothetical protein